MPDYRECKWYRDDESGIPFSMCRCFSVACLPKVGYPCPILELMERVEETGRYCHENFVMLQKRVQQLEDDAHKNSKQVQRDYVQLDTDQT